jgi:hypothetical protein
MKTFLIATALLLAATPAFAAKSCDELVSEIAAKLEANQVKKYSLEIVPAGQEVPGKVVGTCDGGAKKIVYSKDADTVK